MSTDTLRWPTGSAYICPTVAYNDLDFTMYMEASQVDTYRQLLLGCGWEACNVAEYPDWNDSGWEAFRKGQWNLILCWQPGLYLRWLAKYEQEPGEAPPLGIILCSGKKQEQVELLELDASGIHVAEYLTSLPPREVLQAKLHEAIARSRARLENRGEDA